MESQNDFKEFDIKNRACYYFDDTIRIWDRDDKKSYETYKSILIYDISYKTSTGAKLLCIRFDKINGLIKNHNKIGNLV